MPTAASTTETTQRRPATAERIIPLPAPRLSSRRALERILFERRSIREYTSEPLTLSELGQLLWSCQGITSNEGFRTAPSAGAVYPLEIYAAADNVTGLAPGIYHYVPGPGQSEHRLEQVKQGATGEKLFALSTKQDFIKQVPLNVLFTSVTARMEEKYGEAALRYVFMEMGHAAQNLHLQAEASGLGSVAVGYLDESAVRALLGAAVDPYYFVSVGRRK